ncbi:EAL domain-containing protein [Methylococcus sp. EFPC2]|uniref:bifunctional diguanylate cyclase/phosphodiesterase n=1 Tax=Methylococcus sp. EFPC2 TaxID=2812648 RepID=UPI00196776A0|nr:EAL domain-containing protein [Methylococcus sp. EFPC2]QSA98667.1 EAL domain-containing protein [Methylococcus sp. EFPC2]
MRWKLIILLLLLSLPLSVLFAQLFRLYLLDRHQESRFMAMARYEQQINGLIRQQRKHLEQVAAALPALSHVRDDLGKDDLEAFKLRFDQFWSAFQLDMGLSDALYVEYSGILRAQWTGGEDMNVVLASPAWQQVQESVRRNETPSSFVDCTVQCGIRALAPVLAQSRMTGMFAVGASLADTVLTFHDTAAADIAVLAEPNRAEEDGLVGPWGLKLEAASNRERNHVLLQRLASEIPLSQLAQQPQRLTTQDGVYEVGQIGLSPENRAPGMRILVLEDISAGLADIDRAVWRSLLAALLSTASSMVLIYVSLGRHLDRILRTAHAIPLLGRSEFERLRRIVHPRKGERFFDEIDLLDNTAIALSERLEQLEHQVEERTQSLRAALREITLEKEFADNLLEHAEVIIATSDQAGCLLTLNQYGRKLTGYSETDVIGLPLLNSVLLPDAAIDMYGRLREIIAGQTRHWRHESAMNAFGENAKHEISWVHTRLSGAALGEAALLSVGLDISERKRNERHLNYLQAHDPLTDTLNRRGFQDALERMLDMAQRLHIEGALLYLDLDRFKYLNDIAGHQAGDDLLTQVANELKSLLGQVPTLGEVGRLGGDEFALATLNVDREQAISLAERVIQALMDFRMDTASGYRVTASVGIALFPEHGRDARELLVNADIAMFQAKSNKRAGWHLFSAEEKARERMYDWVSWEERIKQGIAHDHFVLFYQPVVRLSDNKLSHYEVLLRLRNEDGSISTPGDFLEVAERSGLIGELDRWVVRNSLKKLASMPPEAQGIGLAINLSGASIGDTQLLEDLRGLLQSSAVDPSRVIFEITETAAVADFNEARAFVNTLREWGCVLALDDFGSGFASFYYLKQFSVDCIKIDGAFIRNLPDNRDDQISVRAMVEMARAYGKKTVAEFVENEAIVRLLMDYGVDYAQGYHIGKPAPDLLSMN